MIISSWLCIIDCCLAEFGGVNECNVHNVCRSTPILPSPTVDQAASAQTKKDLPTKRTDINLGSFVVDGSSLQTMMQDPPSIKSESIQFSSDSPVVDVISIGSMSKLDYLTAQISTWASHRSTRHFWGFSEVQDFDRECSSSTSAYELDEFVVGCKDILSTLFQEQDDVGSFFSDFYGVTEGGRTRSGDAGWMCAQRRVGRSFGWLHSQYAEGVTTIPDYLVIVDDDTYMDMEEVLTLLKDKENERGGGAFGMSGCVFESGWVQVQISVSY